MAATSRLYVTSQNPNYSVNRTLARCAGSRRLPQALGAAMRELVVREVDPQCKDALALLRLAATEARQLYPELHAPSVPEPTNAPTPPRGIYLVAYLNGEPIAMGAHRPLDVSTTEIRRMYVRSDVRRLGAARMILDSLAQHARTVGFSVLRLETGFRQVAAMRLYEAYGFQRIALFGQYAQDPTSVCFEKAVSRSAEGDASQVTPSK